MSEFCGGLGCDKACDPAVVGIPRLTAVVIESLINGQCASLKSLAKRAFLQENRDAMKGSS